MKITIESTTKIIDVNGIDCRLWEGTTESGIQVQCLITRIAVAKTEDCSQFEAELKEQKQPSFVQAYPLRMVL